MQICHRGSKHEKELRKGKMTHRKIRRGSRWWLPVHNVAVNRAVGRSVLGSKQRDRRRCYPTPTWVKELFAGGDELVVGITETEQKRACRCTLFSAANRWREGGPHTRREEAVRRRWPPGLLERKWRKQRRRLRVALGCSRWRWRLRREKGLKEPDKCNSYEKDSSQPSTSSFLTKSTPHPSN